MKKNKNAFISLLELLKVKHSYSHSLKYYRENPLNNTLMGISKMLSEYGIENKSIYFENKEEFQNIPTPFIAHLQGSGFAVIETISNNTITYQLGNKHITEKFENFIKKWNKVVLIPEKNEDSIEPNYKEHKVQETFNTFEKILFVCILLFISIKIFIVNQLYQYFFLSLAIILNIIGIYISYLLILKQLKIKSRNADRICYSLKKGDCNSILDSKAAKFMGIIGWSDVGMSYFLSNLILILFFPTYIHYMALINICALPYSFWSVWYQKIKAKIWCPLCLIVQALLWLLFFTHLIGGYIRIPEFTINNVLTIGSIYLLPFIIISFTNSLIGEFLKEKEENKTLKKNKI